MKFLRRLHFIIGFAAMTMAVISQISVFTDNNGIKPFNNFMDWRQELLLVDFLLFVCALCLLLSGSKLTALSTSFYEPLLFEALLACASFNIFMRYFSLSSAVFTLLPLINSTAISLYRIKKGCHDLCCILGTTLFVFALFFSLFFLGCSYFYVGA